MGFATTTVLVVRSLAVAGTLAGLAVAASASEGYFMRAKVTKVHADGTIDFWVTSVHGLPRELPAATGTDLSQLPKLIATLELKSMGTASEDRDPLPRGSRISLRGDCEKLDRATLAPVIQVRLETGQRWRQANLEPTNRVAHAGFKQIAATVCGPDTPRGASP